MTSSENIPFTLIFNGNTEVKLEHEGEFPETAVNIASIRGGSILYYRNDDARTAVETYMTSISEEADKPVVKQITSGFEIIELPKQICIGNKLDLNDVIYGGQKLSTEQYTLDYDHTNTSLGERTVLLTLSDESLKQEDLIESQISAKKIDGNLVSGTVYVFEPVLSTSFTIQVKNHTGSNLDKKCDSCESSLFVISVKSKLLGTNETVGNISISPSNQLASVNNDVTVTAPSMLDYTFKDILQLHKILEDIGIFLIYSNILCCKIMKNLG